VQSSIAEGYVYFGLVNASEAAKGLSFSRANADLFLSITYTIPAPVAPTNLQASGVTLSGCTLTWLKPPGTVDGYKIYKDDVFLQNASGLSATIQNLTPGATYSFKVTAYNNGGESPKSTPVSVTTVAAPLGATINNPIDLGNLGPCSLAGRAVDVIPGTGYGNEYGNSFDDVWYRFNLTAASSLSLSNCKQDGVSGMLYLLNYSGNIVAGVPGQDCDVGYETIYSLQPGTYYVVSESTASYLTYLYMNIYIPGPACRMALPVNSSPPSADQAMQEAQLEKSSLYQSQGHNAASRIYPNPASHYLFLNLQDGPAVIQVVNKDGIRVKEIAAADKSVGLNVSDLPAGLYLVKIVQHNKLRTEKLLIER
jgi:hypothetical protein